MAQLYSEKGSGAAAHLDLKKQARKSEVFLHPLNIGIFKMM